jgi:hypothetical protein
MKRPISLTIVGAGWFLIGLFGAVNEGIHTHGFAIPGTNFINLLVGVGLLIGWRICRWYALFVAGCTFAFVLAFLPWALLNTGRLQFNFPALLVQDGSHEAISAMAIALIMTSYLVLSGLVVLVLRRQDVREYFAPRVAQVI